MPFSSYDAHGLRLLWHAHSEAMAHLQNLDRPFDERAKAALSRQVVENLMKAYDSGVRDPSALSSAALRGVRPPSVSS
jgi:hypothetical protein